MWYALAGFVLGLVAFPVVIVTVGLLTEDPHDPEVQWWSMYTAMQGRDRKLKRRLTAPPPSASRAGS